MGYISCYNISKATNGKPQSVKGVMPGVNINWYDARRAAVAIEQSSEVTSCLPFGAEYDTVFEWLHRSRAKSYMEVVKESAKGGNYMETENSPRAIAETGSREEGCANNIYDLAGNVNEWALEQFGSVDYVFLGGNYEEEGKWYTNAVYRGHYNPNDMWYYTGFRAVLYIK